MTAMLTYKASYKYDDEDKAWLAEVLDFPGTISFGLSLEEARKNLSSALLDMAETNLVMGEALPLPDATLTDPEADIEEPIYLLLQTGTQLEVKQSA
jgi:predicted RNase H-like HicB family nuclease